MKKIEFATITLLIIILIVSILNLTVKYFPLTKEKVKFELLRLYKVGDKTYSLTPKGDGIKIIWGNKNYPMIDLNQLRVDDIDLDRLDEKEKLGKYETIPLFFTETNFKFGEKEYKFNVVIDNSFQVWLDPDCTFNNSVLKEGLWRILPLIGGIETLEQVLDNPFGGDKLDNSKENNTIGPFVFSPDGCIK